MEPSLEILLGNAITEYTPNAIKFRGLSWETLQQILEQGFTTSSASFNAAPSVIAFIEFARKYHERGAIATFDGIAFANTETSNLVIDAIAVIGVKDLDFAGEFVRFVWGCDELEISSQKLSAWWD